MERHGLQFGMCLSPPSSDDFVTQRAMSVLWEHVEGCRPLCVVMSPTHNRLQDLAVEIATAQLRNGRHFVCIMPTNSSLNHAGSLEALRFIRRVHTAIADGCTFGCRSVVTEHLVAAESHAFCDDSAATREGVQAVMFTCSELWVSRCLPVCQEPW